MAKQKPLKEKILFKGDEKKFDLTDYEFAYLRDMNTVLMYHQFRQKLMEGFLTYIVTNRLGYTKIPEGAAMQYEIDPNFKSKTLTVRIIPKGKHNQSEQ